MSNVRQMLTERLRRAIESARNSYESQPYKHAVYRLSKTEWFSGAISELRNENPNAPQATLAEMLDVLTEHTEYLAEREARQIERTLDALGIEHASLTEKALVELVHSWPWSSGAPMHGSPKDLAPMLLGEITKQPGKKPNSDKLRELLLWARDALKSLPDTPPRGALTVGGFDDELAFVSLALPNEHGAPTPPINSEQLTALYAAAVPEGVRYARSFFHLLERVASGDAERYLLERVAPEALSQCAAEDTQDARDALAPAVRQHARQLSDALAFSIPKDAAAADALAPELYARSATYIEKLGSEGRNTADKYRERAAERANKTTAEKWTPWRRDGDSVPQWLLNLAFVAWRDELERERNARPFALSTVQHAGDRYAKVPKILPPISWAMGAPGMRAVKIDGDTYAPEPGMAAKLVPRSFALLSELVPGHARRPHQTALAIDHEEDSTALAVAVTGAMNYAAIAIVAAKLGILMLASESVRNGLLQRATLGELARWVHPSAKKIQARELRATSSGLDELRGLFVFLPDGRKVQVFDAVSAATPELARGDMEIAWGLTPTFAAVLGSDIAGPSLTGAEYRGDFLVNLDGAMRIPSKRPSLLRHYIRSAAHWNAAFKPGSRGEFDPSRLPIYTAEQWASITNSLPPGVVEYLGAAGKKASRAATSTHRAAWSKKRTEMMNDLAELEAMGLVLVEHKGRDGFQLLPPDVFLEAKNEAMTNGRRPDRGGNK